MKPARAGKAKERMIRATKTSSNVNLWVSIMDSKEISLLSNLNIEVCKSYTKRFYRKKGGMNDWRLLKYFKRF